MLHVDHEFGVISQWDNAKSAYAGPYFGYGKATQILF